MVSQILEMVTESIEQIRSLCKAPIILAVASKKSARTPLSQDERDGIILAVNSAFRKLKNLYSKIVPVFESYGFTPPSAGVIARDLSEKIEASIVQHCESFTKGQGHCDLCRFDQDWEVKICKDSGLRSIRAR